MNLHMSIYLRLYFTFIELSTSYLIIIFCEEKKKTKKKFSLNTKKKEIGALCTNALFICYIY